MALNRICIMAQKGCQGLSNARIEAAFKNVFSKCPTMIRTEGRNILVHTDLDIKEKRVRAFAKKLGSFTKFEGSDNSFSFKL